ncbi:cobalamin-5'-phosphate synthase [Streptomyces sp. WMMB 322]|nr:cobalamin-5'-phosphate synthase [Streptomyces sp. WMMB 322]
MDTTPPDDPGQPGGPGGPRDHEGRTREPGESRAPREEKPHEAPREEDTRGTADPAGDDGRKGSGNGSGNSTGKAADAAASAEDGIRFALGTFTVLPVNVPRWDRDSARRGMEWAPLAGLLVGLTAAVAGLLMLLLGTSSLLAAVVSVAVPAVLTRALHLDGLADVADGLGSAKPAEDALRIMKQPDIGPFGVVTLVLVLPAQIAVLNELYDQGGWASGALAVIVSAVTARTALTLAARSGVPAARPEGLGSFVAGTVPVRTAVVVAASVAVLSAAAGAVVGWWNPLFGAVSYLFAVVLGLAVAELLLRHCRRRLGGVTGDVFGALAECAATVTLVVLAFG